MYDMVCYGMYVYKSMVWYSMESIQEQGCFNGINNAILYCTNTIVYGMMYVCIQEHGFNTIVYACMYACCINIIEYGMNVCMYVYKNMYICGENSMV